MAAAVRLASRRRCRRCRQQAHRLLSKIAFIVHAFQDQVRRYQDRVYAFAVSLLRDRVEAQDVTQDVLLRFWEHREEVDPERALSWLLRVTRNASIDVMRRRHRQHDVMDVDTEGVERSSSPAPSPQVDAEHAEFRDHLQAALDRLDEPYRSIVILREVQGFSYQEISGAMDLPLGTVKGYLHRARKRLRKQLNEVTDYATIE